MRKTGGTMNKFDEDLNTYADDYAASTIQMMTIAGKDDDNSFEEYIKQACIDAANWQKQRIMTLLSAEKENTGIGLCEYDAGNENGRMEVINSLTDKIKMDFRIRQSPLERK